jgi:predicted amidohydrolase
MSHLKVTILQYNIAWEDKEANFASVERLLSASGQRHDLIVLPEMFSTGFSMESARLAEDTSGKTMQWVKALAQQFDAAICGSFIAKDEDQFFNRGFFVTPDEQHFYDKRHLFRMGSEPEHFSAGKKRLIATFRGFNICLMVCYDLRFPVWARNVDNQYDLLVYVANWPQPRATAWNALITARAIENVCYVCGVNRIGTDGAKLNYAGDSSLVDFKGNILTHLQNEEKITTTQLSKLALNAFREKFPVWKDADRFEIY